ncbi:putative LRR receptor-like serine/threonine-protein kinase [Acorus gramineus]|uniref:non-specific serine/threonine protein kinase n=1 Tax=Acorus gramineus TaxID=55184 RepID=A0AAV9BK41_ACOGR|nr:putative LRR receptor-like serine/threonine-protein kinase [Acorus gramineus]
MRTKNSVNLAFLILLSCFGGIGFCFLLPQDEVDALKQVAKTLGRPDWNFTVDPCDEKRFPWTIQNPVKGSESYVNCNCSSTVCHVIGIGFKSRNLLGTLPPELVRLPYLGQMEIQGTNMVGPIPSTLSSLKNLIEMILRNCNISGELPDFLAQMTNLKVLDLSYNNFTWLYTGSTSCQQGAVHEVVPCLTSSCHGKNYYLHINCGGEEEKINHTRYVQDDDPGNARRYFESSNGGNWAFSSTGDFMDNDLDNEIYITRNKSTLSMPDAELYMQARISPISLTYYGLCLGNGNYTVNLHFAEIIITNDDSFSSLGKRIFDVYIQGKLVRKDFNIKDEARGSNKVVVKKFPALVEDNTLEIHLYWAGKGTTALPERGTYGPLISAIAVEPGFKPPGGKKIVAIAVGIVASMLFLIIMILGILRWKGYLGRETTMHEDLRGIDLQTGSFTLRQIKAATDNFSAANKIGEGGFGPVFKGLLSDGTIIAVKMLSSKSKQGNREFLNEIGVISAMQHPNLVPKNIN